MKRAILGIIVGYVVWTVIWLVGGVGIAVAFPDAFPVGGPFTEPVPLALVLVLSVVCSLAAGVVCRVLAKAMGPVVVTACLLLLTGIGVQAGAWSSYPLWYHIPFLLLLVPLTMLGGRIACGAASESA